MLTAESLLNPSFDDVFVSVPVMVCLTQERTHTPNVLEGVGWMRPLTFSFCLHWVNSHEIVLQEDTFFVVMTSQDVKWCHLTRYHYYYYHLGSSIMNFTIFLKSQEVTKNDFLQSDVKNIEEIGNYVKNMRRNLIGGDFHVSHPALYVRGVSPLTTIQNGFPACFARIVPPSNNSSPHPLRFHPTLI